jgi:hypothetical protein
MDSTMAIAILTGSLSVTTSVVVTALQNRSQLQKIRKEHEQGYEKALFGKRIELYPQLYCVLSEFIKAIQSGQQSRESLLKFKEATDKLNSEDAIFFSLHTAQISGRLRKYLILLLDEECTKAITDENWKRLWKIIERFENSLKADIGIFNLPVVGASPYQENDILLIDEIDKEVRLLTGSDLWRRDRTEKELLPFQSDSSHSTIDRKSSPKSPLRRFLKFLQIPKRH